MRRVGLVMAVTIWGTAGFVLVANAIMDWSRAPSRVDTEVVDFDPGFNGESVIRVIADAPVDIDPDDGSPADARTADGQPVSPDQAFVAVTGGTGCRTPTSAELHRDGDALFVVFRGGEDYEECEAPVTPFVQFAVDRDVLCDVATLDGAAIEDPC